MSCSRRWQHGGGCDGFAVHYRSAALVCPNAIGIRHFQIRLLRMALHHIPNPTAHGLHELVRRQAAPMGPRAVMLRQLSGGCAPLLSLVCRHEGEG